MRLPFWIETQIYKLIHPQIVTIVETFIDGKPSRKFYGRSLTGNFLQCLYAHFNQIDTVNFAVSDATFFNTVDRGLRFDTGAQTNTLSTVSMALTAGVGVTNQGLTVGSSAVTPTPASFNNGTQIAHGVGAGQLQYGAMGANQGCTIAGQNTSFIFQRVFTNGSGGDVTVRSVCLRTNSVANGLLMYLDSVSPDDVIGNGQVYTVNITFTITT